MKKTIVALMILSFVECIASFQNSSDFHWVPPVLSFIDGNGIAYEIEGIPIRSVSSSFLDSTLAVMDAHYDGVFKESTWIMHDNANALRGIETANEALEPSSEFFGNATDRIGFVPDSKENLEFIFISNDVYYDPNIGDGTPLPGALASLAACAIATIASGKVTGICGANKEID